MITEADRHAMIEIRRLARTAVYLSGPKHQEKFAKLAARIAEHSAGLPVEHAVEIQNLVASLVVVRRDALESPIVQAAAITRLKEISTYIGRVLTEPTT